MVDAILKSKHYRKSLWIPCSSWNINPVERMVSVVVVTHVTVATEIKVMAFGTFPAKSLDIPLHAGVAPHTFMLHPFENEYIKESQLTNLHGYYKLWIGDSLPGNGPGRYWV